jgi:CRISPR/Cas system-associated protein Cas5 (RAMP superfamily)
LLSPTIRESDSSFQSEERQEKSQLSTTAERVRKFIKAKDISQPVTQANVALASKIPKLQKNVTKKVHSPDIDYFLRKSTKVIRNVSDPVLNKKLTKLTEKDGHTPGKKFQQQSA